MTKSDLKGGMIVEIKNGEKLLVFKSALINCYLFIDRRGKYWEMRLYNEDLYRSNDNFYYGDARDYDIVKVYDEKDNLIWERKEARKMTVSEIEEKLGYKIEIIAN